MTSVEVRGLTVEYQDGEELIRPLEDLELEAHDGELVLLLGPSGSGKTTLLSCLAGLLTPQAGKIVVDGRSVLELTKQEHDDYRRNTVGVVFQAFNLISSLTAEENVAVPMRLAGVRAGAARRRAAELLEQVGLGDRSSHRPPQLSGGQQQRVAIARALARNAPVLLADEPTAHLDVVQVDAVVGLLRRLAVPGRTLIVSTHDDRLIPLADRVVELGANTSGLLEPLLLTFAAGQVVFEEGARQREVYVVRSGAVEIYRTRADGSEVRINVVGPGCWFGEIGPLLGLPRNACARTLTDCVVEQIDVRDFRHGLGADERGRQASSVGS